MWRVGRTLGRTLYVDDVLVGMVDTPELAAEIVAAMNEREERARIVVECFDCRQSWVGEVTPGPTVAMKCRKCGKVCVGGSWVMPGLPEPSP